MQLLADTIIIHTTSSSSSSSSSNHNSAMVNPIISSSPSTPGCQPRFHLPLLHRDSHQKAINRRTNTSCQHITKAFHHLLMIVSCPPLHQAKATSIWTQRAPQSPQPQPQPPLQFHSSTRLNTNRTVPNNQSRPQGRGGDRRYRSLTWMQMKYSRYCNEQPALLEVMQHNHSRGDHG